MPAESPLRSLDRSLAFTALLELSQTFREAEVTSGSAMITRLLDEYDEWLETVHHNQVVAGKTDIFAFTREWIKQEGL